MTELDSLKEDLGEWELNRILSSMEDIRWRCFYREDLAEEAAPIVSS